MAPDAFWIEGKGKCLGIKKGAFAPFFLVVLAALQKRVPKPMVRPTTGSFKSMLTLNCGAT